MPAADDQERLAEILRLARARRLSRRGFLEGALSTGAGVAAASSLWATQVAAMTPKRGGHYRVGVHDSGPLDSWDPGRAVSVHSIQLNHAVRGYLTLIGPGGELRPDLAREWSPNADASRWTFRLDAAARFHDGRRVTARDVAASVHHHTRAGATSVMRGSLAFIDRVEAADETTVVFHLHGGVVDLPWLMADYHLPVCPECPDGTIDWQSGIGAGPYRVLRHEAGRLSELERFDGWHREGAYFDRVSILALTETTARQDALLTGQVDAISDVDLKTVGLLQRAPGIAVDEVAGGAFVSLSARTDRGPFGDPHLVRAVKYALNRQGIVDGALFGYGAPGADHPLAAGMPLAPEGIGYDPDRARHHLAAAGAEGAMLGLQVSDAVFAGAGDTAAFLARQAGEAGLRIAPQGAAVEGYHHETWPGASFRMVQWGGRPTPDAAFSMLYASGSVWNDTGFASDRFDRLLIAARGEADAALRAEIHAEMARLVRDTSGAIIPFRRNRVSARREALSHPGVIGGNWELDGARSFERWWFA